MMIIIINTVYKSILHSRLYYIKEENSKKKRMRKRVILCVLCVDERNHLIVLGDLQGWGQQAMLGYISLD